MAQVGGWFSNSHSYRITLSGIQQNNVRSLRTRRMWELASHTSVHGVSATSHTSTYFNSSSAQRLAGCSAWGSRQGHHYSWKTHRDCNSNTQVSPLSRLAVKCPVGKGKAAQIFRRR